MREDIFKLNMSGMAEYFDKPLTKALGNVYWHALKHLDGDDFTEIVKKLVLTSKWFPRVNEILELAPKPLTLENKGSLSWCVNTQKLLDQYGPNSQPVAKDNAA